MDETHTRRLVGTHYPERAVTAVDPVAAGHRPTAVVRFDTHSPVVVQFSDDIEAVRTEAALVDAVRARTDVPAPPTLATGVCDGQAYAISEFRPGTDLHTTFADSHPAHRAAVGNRFGRYLGQLHAAFAFEGCGELVRDPVPDGDCDLAAPSASCAGWLAAYGRRAVERLPAEFEALRPRLLDCLDTAAAEQATPRLFPWDLRPGNALVSDGWLSAVLDWERPMAAPPALALAKTEYLVADWYVEEPAPLRRSFRRGYASVRPPPAVDRIHRVVAIADSAVDSRGAVTNPGYPERDEPASVAFHRRALERVFAE
mgnify:CR=1 FL=1